MTALGFCCARADMDKVFDQLDDDGSGTIEYKELNTILRGKGVSSDRPSSGGKKPAVGGKGAAAAKAPAKAPAKK